ncbi:MAG: hypothetical protein AAGE52_00870, partial [Myxococcota bacterium]
RAPPAKDSVTRNQTQTNQPTNQRPNQTKPNQTKPNQPRTKPPKELSRKAAPFVVPFERRAGSAMEVQDG